MRRHQREAVLDAVREQARTKRGRATRTSGRERGAGKWPGWSAPAQRDAVARAGSRAVVAAHRLTDRHPPRAVITRGAVTRHVPEHTATVGVRALLSEGRRQQATAFHRHTLPGVKPSFQGLDLWFFISKSAVLPVDNDIAAI